MAKSIITQNGIIVNFSKLLAIYVDEELDDVKKIRRKNYLKKEKNYMEKEMQIILNMQKIKSC